jgi:arginine N-succinyltransferase
MGLGQLHPVGELPLSILMDEGFDSETYVNIFDGGATVEGRVAMLKSVVASLLVRLDAAPASAPVQAGASWQLLAAARRAGFRAVLHQAQAQGAHLAPDSDTCALLGCEPGAALSVAPLQGATA